VNAGTWVRIVRGMGRDAKVVAMADALRVRRAEVAGCLVAILGELPAVCPAADFSDVPDGAIELWADWEGKRGHFAKAFRAHVLTDVGTWAAWAKHNGAPLEKSERDAERKRQAREAARAAAEEKARAARAEAQDGARPARAASDGRRADGAGTRRDETGRDETRRDGTAVKSFSISSSGGGRGAVERLIDHLAHAATEADHVAVVEARLRASQDPDAVAGVLLGELQGMHGAEYSPAELAQALTEMAAGEAKFSPRLLRGFLRKLREAPAPPRPSTRQQPGETRLQRAARLAAGSAA
jgi:hypothetical protein